MPHPETELGFLLNNSFQIKANMAIARIVLTHINKIIYLSSKLAQEWQDPGYETQDSKMPFTSS